MQIQLRGSVICGGLFMFGRILYERCTVIVKSHCMIGGLYRGEEVIGRLRKLD